jgi:hypothetical protein
MTLRERIKWIPLPVLQRLTGREIALCGVMAGVMAFAAFIPVTVVAGVGKVISAAVLLEPLIGIILGPLLGIYSAGAGAFVGQIIAPQGAIFGPLTFIPPTVGAATAALLAHSRWKAGTGVMVGVLLLWYSTSIGRELYYYPYVPLIFLGSVFILRNRLGEWIHQYYDQTVRFSGAGIPLMLGGLILILISYSIFLVVSWTILTVIMVCSLVTFIVLLVSRRESWKWVSPLAAGLFFLSAGVSGAGVLDAHGDAMLRLTLVFLCTTYLFMGLCLLHRRILTGLVVSLTMLGILGLFSLITALPSPASAEEFMPLVLRACSIGLLLLGVILFSLMYGKNAQGLRKWTGISFLLAGGMGIIQQILTLSADSQIMRRELLSLHTALPFTTIIEGHEMTITSSLDFYLQKIIPLYTGHVGWLLIFTALLLIGLSLTVHLSLEKISIAYFIIAGCAVLSDLMIGNFLAIHILELQAGMFRAFLFIYPVERMFMAFFATIFGMGVIIPLKKYGFINLIRR